MKMPVIAVDIDEVLVPFVAEIAKHHNHQHGTNLAEDHFHSYDFEKVWGGSTEEAVKKVKKFFSSGAVEQIEPFPEAMLAIKKLENRYRLVIVTARHSDFEATTMRWLKKHFPNVFADIRFANFKEVPKVELCEKLGAIALVDDSLHHTSEATKRGIRGLLFGSYPWNQAKELPEGVIRVKDWNEALKVLLPHEDRIRL